MNKKLKKILPLAMVASVVMTGCNDKSPDPHNKTKDPDTTQETKESELKTSKTNAINELEKLDGYSEYSSDEQVKKAFTVAKANINKETTKENVEAIKVKEIENLKKAINLAKGKKALLEQANLLKLTEAEKADLLSSYDEATVNWVNENVDSIVDPYIDEIKKVTSKDELEAVKAKFDTVSTSAAEQKNKDLIFRHFYKQALLNGLNANVVSVSEEEFEKLISHKLFEEKLNHELEKIKILADAGKTQAVIDHAVDASRNELASYLSYNIKHIYEAQVKKIAEINAVELPKEWEALDKEGFDLYTQKLDSEKEAALTEVENSKTARQVELIKVPTYSYEEFINNVSNLVEKSLLTIELAEGYNQTEVKTNDDVVNVVKNAKTAFQTKLDSFKDETEPTFADFEEVINEQKALLESAINKVVEPYINAKTEEINNIKLTDEEIAGKSQESIEAAKAELVRLQQEAIEKISKCNKNIASINAISVDKTAVLNLLIDQQDAELLRLKSQYIKNIDNIAKDYNNENLSYFGAKAEFDKAVAKAKTNITEATTSNINEIYNNEKVTLNNLGQFLSKKSSLFQIYSDPSHNFTGKGWKAECRKQDSDFGKIVRTKANEYLTIINNSKDIEDLKSVPSALFFVELLNHYLPTAYAKLDEELSKIEGYEVVKENSEIKAAVAKGKNEIKTIGPRYINDEHKTVDVYQQTVNEVTELVNKLNQSLTDFETKLSEIEFYNEFKVNPDIEKMSTSAKDDIKSGKEIDLESTCNKIKEQITKIMTKENELHSEFGTATFMYQDWMHDDKSDFKNQFEEFEGKIYNHKLTLDELDNINVDEKLEEIVQNIRNKGLTDLNEQLDINDKYASYKLNPTIKSIVDNGINKIKNGTESSFDILETVELVNDKIRELEEYEEEKMSDIETANYMNMDWMGSSQDKTEFAKKLQGLTIKLTNHEFSIDELKDLDVTAKIEEFKQEIRQETLTDLDTKIKEINDYKEYKANPTVARLYNSEKENIEQNGEINFGVDSCVNNIRKTIDTLKEKEPALIEELGKVSPVSEPNWVYPGSKYFSKYQFLMSSLITHSYSLEDIESMNISNKLEQFKEEIRKETIEALNAKLNNIEGYEQFKENAEVKQLVEAEINNIKTNGEKQFAVEKCVNSVTEKINSLKAAN